MNNGRRSRRVVPTGDRARERAFTIVELLIVLALLAAIGSLALPPVWKWVEDVRFRETMATFDAAMDAAGAAARRGGRALAVAARNENGRLKVETSEVAGPLSPDEAGDSEGDDSGRAVSVVRYSFPPGFRFADEVRRAGASVAAGPGTKAGATGSSTGETRLGIALFLPDGTAAAGAPLRISDGRGHSAEVVVDAWSGAVRLRPVAVRDEAAASASEGAGS